MAELCVSVRMIVPFLGLAVALQAVVQMADGKWSIVAVRSGPDRRFPVGWKETVIPRP
jgi:hypothetical protein